MKKTLPKALIIFPLVLALALLSACAQRFNAAAYADAVAKAALSGDDSVLDYFSGQAETDFAARRSQTIEKISRSFLTYIGLSDCSSESVSAMNDWVTKVLKKAEISPEDASKNGTVTLCVQPVKIMDSASEPFKEYYENFCAKNDQLSYRGLTESKFENTYVKGAIRVLNKALSNAATGSQVKISISIIPDKNGNYSISTKDFELLMTSAIDQYDHLEADPWPQIVLKTSSPNISYVQGLLDCMYLGQPDLYAQFSGYSEDDGYDMYVDGLYTEAYVFLDYIGVDEAPEEVLDEITDMLSCLYDYSWYEVQQATSGGDVEVTIYPINIYPDTHGAVIDAVDDFIRRNDNYEFSDYTDDEFTAAYVEAIIDIFYDYIAYDLDYADPVTLTVHVDKDEDGYLFISDNDFNDIDCNILNYSLDSGGSYESPENIEPQWAPENSGDVI